MTINHLLSVHLKNGEFKKCAPFTNFIKKIDGATIDDAENLDLVMLMHNLIEHGLSYSETARSLSFYSKDEATNFNAEDINRKHTDADGDNWIWKKCNDCCDIKY